MNERSRDPVDELRHADPAHSSRAPSDSKARVWARVEEAIMEPGAQPTSRKRPVWAFGALAAVAIAGVAVVAVLANFGSAAPSPTLDPGAGIGSCVETYSLQTLATRDLAFDGTVMAIDGEQVSFAVNEAFVGVDSETVTLTASGMTGTSVTSAGGPAWSSVSATSSRATEVSLGPVASPSRTTSKWPVTGLRPHVDPASIGGRALLML